MKYSELKRLTLKKEDGRYIDNNGEGYKIDLGLYPKVGEEYPNAPIEEHGYQVLGFWTGDPETKPQSAEYADMGDYEKDLEKWSNDFKPYAVVLEVL